MDAIPIRNIGIVTIGRNEGDRLVRCLRSLKSQLPPEVPVIYVDSGSTDGSLDRARSMDVQAIALDPSLPFTMARGRNAGFSYLCQRYPQVKYVQFVDGDCELVPGWIEQAAKVLDDQPDVAIACGRRFEKFPNASIYNRLADMEWDTPVGETQGCGGDALMRVEAIRRVEGFRSGLICGEEPEMCIRLRHQGWRILRLDAAMTRHDAAMTRFHQWWRRAVRSGWAVAEGTALHGLPPDRYMVRQSWSGWLWGVILPVVALGLAIPTHGLSGLLLLGYPILFWRIYRYRRQQGAIARHARLYALFCMLSKLPQAIGQAKYWISRWQGKPATLIEYKTTAMGGAKSG